MPFLKTNIPNLQKINKITRAPNTVINKVDIIYTTLYTTRHYLLKHTCNIKKKKITYPSSQENHQ